MSLPARLHSPDLRPLWTQIHQRLSSGRPVSRVRVGPLDDPQRSALADLLGMDRLPGEYATVALGTLDLLLSESVGVDIRSVVAELLGPLGDRAGQRAADEAARTELWQWLSDHEVVKAQPALEDWVAQVRRTGLAAGSVPETQKLLDAALTVLRGIPATAVPLPAFATDVLGDPHALDDPSRLSGLVLRALAAIFGDEPPLTAQDRRLLWERAGVCADELSTLVLAAGIRPSDDSLAARILTACADAGQAAALTLAQLRASASLSFSGSEIWVVENPSVLALALSRFGPRCPPLVCLSGWPSTAGILLLRSLQSRLNYHGDFDGEGIRIAAYVMDKTGAVPWRMSTSDYLAGVHGITSGPDVGRVTDAPWDPVLADAVREHGTAVVEERVANVLLDELALDATGDEREVKYRRD